MTNKPIESFYAGNIEVAVWENHGEDSKLFHSVSAKRTYMDGNGEWKDAGTIHLLPQQIPDAILALQKSHEFLRMGVRQRRKQKANSNGHSEIATGDVSHEGTEGELAGVETEADQEGFVDRVGQQRGGGKRSR